MNAPQSCFLQILSLREQQQCSVVFNQRHKQTWYKHKIKKSRFSQRRHWWKCIVKNNQKVSQKVEEIMCFANANVHIDKAIRIPSWRIYTRTDSTHNTSCTAQVSATPVLHIEHLPTLSPSQTDAFHMVGCLIIHMQTLPYDENANQ